jgi:hypothetical protein
MNVSNALSKSSSTSTWRLSQEVELIVGTSPGSG